MKLAIGADHAGFVLKDELAANTIHGVRAALGVTTDEVHFRRAHNDPNVLALGGRHQLRVDTITQLETN